MEADDESDGSLQGRSLGMIDWYAMRWKIETFHKILKSGCRAEDSRLRTAECLTNLIAIHCILSWRIFWMTMINRIDPDTSASVAPMSKSQHWIVWQPGKAARNFCSGRCITTQLSWPSSAATLLARAIHRRAIWSCGEASLGSPTSFSPCRSREAVGN